jgi:uncharacterized protein YeaO (DUF488 family)
MWHLCTDKKWTHNSNLNSIDPKSIPYFENNTNIDCIICAYSEHLFLFGKVDEILPQQESSQESDINNQNQSTNEEKKVDLKSLTSFIKKVQKYEQKQNQSSSKKSNIELDIKVTVELHTSRINTSDKDKLDITRKSATRFGLNFAPSWNILNKVKKEEIDFETYKLLYIEEMKKSYVENNAAWFLLLTKERVCLICYCTDHEKCHRTILARDILTLYGAKYVGEITDSSDLSASSKIQTSKESENNKNKEDSKKSKKSSGSSGQGSLF